MTVEQLRLEVLPVALALLPAQMDSRPARAMLVAIALQETGLRLRRQVAGYRRDKTAILGPARGFWQFEEAGGVNDVLTHRSTREHAAAVCGARGLDPTKRRAVHHALEHDDVLAAAFARLLLYIDPRQLPQTAEGQMLGWLIYLAQWRPGKPKPDTWRQYYATAWRAPVETD